MGKLVGGRGAAFAARDGPTAAALQTTRVSPAHRLAESPLPLLESILLGLSPRRGKRRRQDVPYDDVIRQAGSP